jgi:chemotaxis protein histidine kinase CheA
LSEEFLRVAKEEINQDIAEIGNLLNHCSNDDDITKHASDIEKHIHKIKGLAPMMGQDQLGNIASLIDKILKVILSGKPVSGIYRTITQSHGFMKNAIDGNITNYDLLHSEITQSHKDIL